jgi:uncharacterized protein
MKFTSILITAALALAAVGSTNLAFAQSGDNAAESKKSLAERIVKAQQGAEFDRMLQQLANSTTPGLIDSAGPRLETAVPAAKRDAARTQLNDALTAYVADVTAFLKTRAATLTTKTLVPLYEERFSLEELRTLAAFFESDANRKYQQAAPEFGNKLVQALVNDTRKAVEDKGLAFVKKADDILVKNGAPAAPQGAAPAPATAPKPATTGSQPAKK